MGVCAWRPNWNRPQLERVWRHTTIQLAALLRRNLDFYIVGLNLYNFLFLIILLFMLRLIAGSHSSLYMRLFGYLAIVDLCMIWRNDGSLLLFFFNLYYLLCNLGLLVLFLLLPIKSSLRSIQACIEDVRIIACIQWLIDRSSLGSVLSRVGVDRRPYASWQL